MKVVISGGTELSFQFAKKLTKDNDLVVIADNERIADLFSQLDLQVITGSPTSLTVLQDDRIKDAEAFIACNHSDEVNVISCLAVKQISNARTFCFVNKEHYFQTFTGELGEQLAIDKIIWPELFLGRYISEILAVPGAIDVKFFGNEDLKLLEFRATKIEHGLGKEIRELNIPKGVLAVSIIRDKEIIIPNGTSQILWNDKIIFIGHAAPMKLIEARFRPDNDKNMNVTIIGGGNVGFNLCKALEPFRNVHITLVETNETRANFLATELSDKVLILNANGSDPETLKNLNLEDCDCLVALTGSDEKNLFVSMQAKVNNATKIITRAHKIDNIDFFEKLGIDVVVSSQLNVVQSITKELSDKAADIYTFIEKGKAEIREVLIPDKFPVTRIMDLKLPEGVIISAIKRGNRTMVPSGQDKIKENDQLRVFCASGTADSINEFIVETMRKAAIKKENGLA